MVARLGKNCMAAKKRKIMTIEQIEDNKIQRCLNDLVHELVLYADVLHVYAARV